MNGAISRQMPRPIKLGGRDAALRVPESARAFRHAPGVSDAHRGLGGQRHIALC